MMTPSPAPSHTSRAIGLMLFGVFLFALNDALGKWLVATYTVGQVLLIRSAAALCLLIPMALREDGGIGLIRLNKPWLHAARAAMAVVEIYAFYAVLKFMPLADTMAYWLAAPIYVVAISALLGERTTGVQRLLILIGFAGVLLVLRPSGASLQGPALLALLGGLSYAAFLLLTRRLAGSSATTLVFWQIFASLLLGVVLAPGEWVTPRPLDLALLGLLGLVAMGAHLVMSLSFRLAPASVVVPYQYTMIIWAILFGYVLFGEMPDMVTMAGVGVIICVGFALYLTERSAGADQAREQQHRQNADNDNGQRPG